MDVKGDKDAIIRSASELLGKGFGLEKNGVDKIAEILREVTHKLLVLQDRDRIVKEYEQKNPTCALDKQPLGNLWIDVTAGGYQEFVSSLSLPLYGLKEQIHTLMERCRATLIANQPIVGLVGEITQRSGAEVIRNARLHLAASMDGKTSVDLGSSSLYFLAMDKESIKEWAIARTRTIEQTQLHTASKIYLSIEAQAPDPSLHACEFDRIRTRLTTKPSSEPHFIDLITSPVSIPDSPHK